MTEAAVNEGGGSAEETACTREEGTPRDELALGLGARPDSLLLVNSR